MSSSRRESPHTTRSWTSTLMSPKICLRSSLKEPSCLTTAEAWEPSSQVKMSGTPTQSLKHSTTAGRHPQQAMMLQLWVWRFPFQIFRVRIERNNLLSCEDIWLFYIKVGCFVCNQENVTNWTFWRLLHPKEVFLLDIVVSVSLVVSFILFWSGTFLRLIWYSQLSRVNL